MEESDRRSEADRLDFGADRADLIPQCQRIGIAAEHRQPTAQPIGVVQRPRELIEPAEPLLMASAGDGILILLFHRWFPRPSGAIMRWSP